MKYFLVLCAVFFCWTFVSGNVGGIECYACFGTDYECAKDKLVADKDKYLVTCPLSLDRCITVWTKKDEKTSVMKTCSTKWGCDVYKKACDMTDAPCAVNCCYTDECNAGSPGLPTGSIKCYTCDGTVGKCAKDKLVADKAKYLMTCPLSMDRCVTVWFKKYDKTEVTKSCYGKALCDKAKKVCRFFDNTDEQCVVNCCDTDECNAGSPGLPNSK
ncbi:uncharacterized protein LOC144637944 isoform X2 [Oculina patagonica]